MSKLPSHNYFGRIQEQYINFKIILIDILFPTELLRLQTHPKVAIKFYKAATIIYNLYSFMFDDFTRHFANQFNSTQHLFAATI